MYYLINQNSLLLIIKMSTKKDDKECCKKEEKILVKATDLPRTGNPYPPKDFVLEERPSLLESKITSFRSSIQPFTAPVGSAYNKASDIMATGYAHSSSAIQGLSENQRPIFNGVLIAVAGLIGARIVRRRKFITGTTFALGTFAALYPREATEKGQMLWYIAKNKLPIVAKEQYDKYFNGNVKNQETSEQPKTTN